MLLAIKAIKITAKIIAQILASLIFFLISFIFFIINQLIISVINNQNIFFIIFSILNGAQRGNRTLTPKEWVFETHVSTNSTIWALYFSKNGGANCLAP
jgi:hypothetical protein